MPDGRASDAELNRLWNALIEGAGDPDVAGADPVLAETLRRVHVMTLAPPPIAARARVEDGMRAILASPSNGKGAVDPRQVRVLVHAPHEPRNPWLPNTGADPPVAPRAAARFGWAAMQTATALLVLLTLGFAFLVAAPGRFDGQTAAVIRSVFAPAAPIPGVTVEETLLAATLPAEALPYGDRLSGNLSYFTVEPGIKSNWEPILNGCCPGLRVDYVVEGELIMRLGGPARVVRANADLASQQVPAGTEVLLGSGDTLMSRYEDAFTSANPGPAQTRLLDWVFVDGYVTANQGNPTGWDYHFDGHSLFDLAMPQGAATLRLDRVALGPGAILPRPPDAAAQFGLTLADDEPLGAGIDGTLENIGDTPITVHVLTVTPEGPARDAAAPLAPEAALDTVFTATLPAEMVPAAGNLDFLLWNVSLDPGAEGPASAQSWTQTRICCPGPMITHVVEGELSVRVDGPLRVFRGSGVAPGSGDVPPGTEVTLSPGDTALFAYDRPATFANRGATPVHIVGGGIFAGAVRSGPAAGSAYLDYNEEYAVSQLPPGPVDATLVRATLPPAGEVASPSPDALVLEVGATGDADIAQRADGGLRNIGPETETIYVLTLTPSGAASAETP